MPQHEVKARCFSIVNQFARFQNTRRRRKGTDQYLVYSPLKYKHDSLYVLLRTFSMFPPLEFLVHLVHTLPLVCPPTRFVYESVCIGNVPPVINLSLRKKEKLFTAAAITELSQLHRADVAAGGLRRPRLEFRAACREARRLLNHSNSLSTLLRRPSS